MSLKRHMMLFFESYLVALTNNRQTSFGLFGSLKSHETNISEIHNTGCVALF